MGPNDNLPEMIAYINGTPLGKMTSALLELTSDIEPISPKVLGFDLANGSDFTASFKLSHMSRKSFVSNLIKLGYSKKEAKKIAWSVHKEGHCYASTYAIYTIGRFGLN